MIILAIIALAGVVIAVLSGILTLPDFPPELQEYVTDFATLCGQGVTFLLSFVYGNVVASLIGLLIAAYSLYQVYKVVMFLIKKIPMFGVSD